jgi:hypothetical protein
LQTIWDDLGYGLAIGHQVERRPTGKPQRPKWTSYNEQGMTADGKLRFDAERNWILLEAILLEAIFSSDKLVEIRIVLVSEPLKKRLLDHSISLQEEASGAESDKSNLLRSSASAHCLLTGAPPTSIAG